MQVKKQNHFIGKKKNLIYIALYIYIYIYIYIYSHQLVLLGLPSNPMKHIFGKEATYKVNISISVFAYRGVECL